MRIVVDGAGRRWQVTPSGRRTQYARDELSLEFRQEDGDERRYVRFSPNGAQVPELAFEEVSDAQLVRLLAIAQPAWTAPDGGYRSS